MKSSIMFLVGVVMGVAMVFQEDHSAFDHFKIKVLHMAVSAVDQEEASKAIAPSQELMNQVAAMAKVNQEVLAKIDALSKVPAPVVTPPPAPEAPKVQAVAATPAPAPVIAAPTPPVQPAPAVAKVDYQAQAQADRKQATIDRINQLEQQMSDLQQQHDSWHGRGAIPENISSSAIHAIQDQINELTMEVQ